MTYMKVTTKNGHSKPHYRPTWAEIDLKAIEYNYKQVKRSSVKIRIHGRRQGQRVWPWHRRSVEASSKGSALITWESLRRMKRFACEIAGSRRRYWLGSVLPDEVKALVENNITLTLCNEDLLPAIREVAAHRAQSESPYKDRHGDGQDRRLA